MTRSTYPAATLAAVILGFSFSTLGQAAVPDTLSYQGSLTDRTATSIDADTQIPLPSIAQTTMDIEETEIYIDVSRFDGTLGPFPYRFEIAVIGSNIGSVIVQTPNGAQQALTEEEEEWRYAKTGFSTLADISSDPEIGFGDFAFIFTAQDATTETATVTYDPGTIDPHAGYADVTFPSNGQTDVPVNVTFTWICTDAPCGNFAWYMEVFPTDGSGVSFEADIIDPSATDWTPGILSPGTSYGFVIWTGTVFGGSPQTLQTTPSGDEFVYVQGFETSNEIGFSTLFGPGDSDGDGIADDSDNCLVQPNADQRDTDADGIGNLCDPDVAQPNDCTVNFLDLNVYKANFFAAGDLDTDNNGDGSTNFVDLNVVKTFFFGPPGPSANGCN